jgi:cysteine desulfuration protein SufE
MALAAILSKTLSGASLDEVAAVPSDMIYGIFGRELSLGKSLGLMGMVNMVRAAAQAQLRQAARQT